MEIFLVIGVVGSIWFFFFRHSNVRVDSTDLAKTFLRAFEHSGDYDHLERYKSVMASIFVLEGLPQKLDETEEELATVTLGMAIEKSVQAYTPLTFRSVVYYAIIPILANRYDRPLKDSELKVIGETIVAEIPLDR